MGLVGEFRGCPGYVLVPAGERESQDRSGLGWTWLQLFLGMGMYGLWGVLDWAASTGACENQNGCGTAWARFLLPLGHMRAASGHRPNVAGL